MNEKYIEGLYRKAIAGDKEALNKLTFLANAGNAQAQYKLGVMYQKGEGVKRNYETAVNWYYKAAKQGYAPAQNNLGVMYAERKGVEQSPSQALFCTPKQQGKNMLKPTLI